MKITLSPFLSLSLSLSLCLYIYIYIYLLTYYLPAFTVTRKKENKPARN